MDDHNIRSPEVSVEHCPLVINASRYIEMRTASTYWNVGANFFVKL